MEELSHLMIVFSVPSYMASHTNTQSKRTITFHRCWDFTL